MPLKTRAVRPPTGWVYEQSETSFPMSARTFEQLLDVVIRHRLGNSLSPTDRESVGRDVEEYIRGLMRGTRALWDFFETKISLPPPAPRQAAIVGTFVASSLAIPTAPLTIHGLKTAKKTCRTCGG